MIQLFQRKWLPSFNCESHKLWLNVICVYVVSFWTTSYRNQYHHLIINYLFTLYNSIYGSEEASLSLPTKSPANRSARLRWGMIRWNSLITRESWCAMNVWLQRKCVGRRKEMTGKLYGKEDLHLVSSHQYRWSDSRKMGTFSVFSFFCYEKTQP